jgi:hypothetical protein
MADRNWIVDFKLPQLSASHYWHSVEVEASNIGLAVNRAWAEIKKRPAVKGRRIKDAQISIRSASKDD